MEERKLSSESFAKGHFYNTLHHDMHLAGLNEQSRERVLSALEAGVEHVAHKEGLQYGVGPKHAESVRHFIENGFEGRRDLLPKEREFIHTAIDKHYGIEPESV